MPTYRLFAHKVAMTLALKDMVNGEPRNKSPLVLMARRLLNTFLIIVELPTHPAAIIHPQPFLN
jgi:hypothetical protein